MNVAVQPYATPAVAFPLGLPALFFCALAILVIHLCQQMIEQTAAAIDPPSRKLRASRAAIGIGGLVWVLDVTGFFIYPDLAVYAPQLQAALAALIIDVATTRAAVPQLSTGTSPQRIVLASAGLSVGLLVGHALLTYGLFNPVLRINPVALAGSLLFAIVLGSIMALRHQRARFRTLDGHGYRQEWQDKVLGGLALVPLHWSLLNAFPLPLSVSRPDAGDIRLLATVLAFGLALGAEQAKNLRFERTRQHHFRKAVEPGGALATDEAARREYQLALLAARLPTLLRADRIVVHFQPIVSAPDGPVHLEALLRLEDPVLGKVNPEHFFLACALQQQTARADRIVIQASLDQLRCWRQRRFSAVVNVNVSPGTLLEPSFGDWLLRQLQQRSLSPSALRLEITEHALIANAHDMIRIIGGLKALGIAVVMDDFGSGYSSLGRLVELPISGLKCDRLFIRGLAHDPRRQALLRRIAELAGDLGIPVTAEGVETGEELAIVRDCGIGCIQGFYFARPMPAAQVPDWYRLQQHDAQPA